jgi:hypothetical protein
MLVTIATNSRKASVGCLAINSWKAKFSIGPSECYIEEATESMSQSLSTSVGLRSESPEAEESSARSEL